MAITEPMACALHGVPFGQVCYWCQPWVTTTWSPAPPPQGWQCPVCQRVMAPMMTICPYCPPKTEMFITKGSREAITPCQPSREGGMCGCGEPDDGPVIRLPAHMAEEGGYQIVRIGAGFTEVFPGLELAVFLSPDDQGRVTAHFRLTPPDDGQEHD